MDVFFTDLDRTLIYSYKQEIGKEKRSVELYQGREISFMTEKTYRLLLEVKKWMCIVPVTTRTMEQYSRIDLGIGPVRYALVCNGGVLLIDGKPEQPWYEQSLRMVENSQEEMEQAVRYLEQEKSRNFEIRLIQNLFVFTRCQSPQEAVQRLTQALQPRTTDVFTNGEKVYVVPKKLNKGMAVARFAQYCGTGMSAAAGDSMFDLPMLARADLAMAPAGYGQAGWRAGNIHEMAGENVFSEEMLEFLLERICAN